MGQRIAFLDGSIEESDGPDNSRLDITRRAISSAASRGTPFFSIEPSVRIVCSVSTFNNSGPNMRSNRESNARRNFEDAHARNHPRA
ncbi:MAG: hypothetical protein ACREPS_04490 [Rhodanobacteraceae bacterium]